MLTPTLASTFAALALGHVTREYPNKLDHVLLGAEDLREPRALHPVFYGSFDWHSCVHGYWLLARVYRRYPDLPEAARIRAMIDTHFTPANIAVETAYIDHASRGGFERPYGWAWLLMLAAELAAHDSSEGRRWYQAISPLAQSFRKRLLAYLPKATYPVRAGAHTNTAFAIRLASDYATAVHDVTLSDALRAKAHDWYHDDVDCQAWEPSGDDFLSPALMEAECMRRVLTPKAFSEWFTRFLPRIARREPQALFIPAQVSDRTDGKIAHLDGLNLSRAWCWRSLARVWEPQDPRRAAAIEAAERHLDSSLPHVAGDYMGEHWLATFALLALDV